MKDGLISNVYFLILNFIYEMQNFSAKIYLLFWYGQASYTETRMVTRYRIDICFLGNVSKNSTYIGRENNFD